MGFKQGQLVVLKEDSVHYTGRYAGTDVEIVSIDTDMSCTVRGFDNYEFMCPISYLIDYDDYYMPKIPKVCECGSNYTMTKKHLDFCQLYKD